MPSYELSWGFDWNNNIDGGDTATTTKNAIIALKSAFTADLEDHAGTPAAFTSGKWAVVSSCDGVTADGTDRWVDNTDIVFNTPGSAHSWIQFSKANYPTTGVTTYVIIDCRDGSPYTDVSVIWSTVAPTGGSVTDCPTTNATYTYDDMLARYIAAWSPTNVSYAHASRSARGDVFFGTWRQGYGYPWYSLLTLQLDTPRVSDPWPLYIAHSEYFGGVGALATTTGGIGLSSYTNGKTFWTSGQKNATYGFYSYPCTPQSSAGGYAQAIIDVNGDDIDGKYPQLPIFIASMYSGFYSVRGRLVDFWSGPHGTPAPVLGTVTPAAGTPEYCLWGHVWVPCNQAPLV